MHFADSTSVKQNAFSERCFATVNVRRNANVAHTIN
jgi:hypothetical protein